MATHTSLKSLFEDIADAIRAKEKSSADIVADNFPDRIAAINTDPSQDATVTSGAQILSPYTAYSKGVKYTGTIATKTSSDVSVGATVTVPAGYYASNVSKSVPTMTLPTSASSSRSGTTKATITPTTSAQYINIPTGYNSSAASYTISAMSSMTLPTSTSSSASGASKATISHSTSATYLNIPAGYNASAAYYTISAVPVYNGEVS